MYEFSPDTHGSSLVPAHPHSRQLWRTSSRNSGLSSIPWYLDASIGDSRPLCILQPTGKTHAESHRQNNYSLVPEYRYASGKQRKIIAVTIYTRIRIHYSRGHGTLSSCQWPNPCLGPIAKVCQPFIPSSSLTRYRAWLGRKTAGLLTDRNYKKSHGPNPHLVPQHHRQQRSRKRLRLSRVLNRWGFPVQTNQTLHRLRSVNW